MARPGRTGRGGGRGRRREPDADPAALRARLRDAEETLRAIRGGDVDAIVVHGPAGERVYTLHGAEHSYRLLVEAMHEGAATLGRDGAILYWNRAFAAMLGRPLEKVMGTAFATHLPAGRREDLDELLGRATESPSRMETALRRPDGETLPVLLSASTMSVDGQSLLCVVATDLSEVGRLQDAVRIRDEFLSIASHELKTPLTSLLLYLDAIGRLRDVEAQPDRALVDRMEGARRQARRLAHLVNDLLDVSRLRAGRLDLLLEDVDLGVLVREVVDRHRREAGAAGCDLEVATAPLVGRWDRSRLDQVATNLVSNAIKYGKGRPVRVEVAAAAGGRVRLVVSDQGIGIDPADHGRIFERFERVASPREFGGMGLGLWITREIVQRLGGAVWVESGLGRGARFVVELPLEGTGAAAGSAA